MPTRRRIDLAIAAASRALNMVPTSIGDRV
jgi:hypothetical protein